MALFLNETDVLRAFFSERCFGEFWCRYAILMMTVMVKLCFMLLAISSARSMAKIKKLKPFFEQLKQKYKDD